MAFPMLLMRRLVWSSCGPTATFYNITSRHHNKRNKNNSKKESILHLPTCQFHPSKGKALLLLYVMLHSTSSSIKSNTFGIMCGLGDTERCPFLQIYSCHLFIENTSFATVGYHYHHMSFPSWCARGDSCLCVFL